MKPSDIISRVDQALELLRLTKEQTDNRAPVLGSHLPPILSNLTKAVNSLCVAVEGVVHVTPEDNGQMTDADFREAYAPKDEGTEKIGPLASELLSTLLFELQANSRAWIFDGYVIEKVFVEGEVLAVVLKDEAKGREVAINLTASRRE